MNTLLKTMFYADIVIILSKEYTIFVIRSFESTLKLEPFRKEVIIFYFCLLAGRDGFCRLTLTYR